MDGPPPTSDKTGIFAELGTNTLKYFPLALAATYIVGFIIVALHLAGYGASPLELIKIQYLAAGMWFGILVVVYFGSTALLSKLFEEEIGTLLLFKRKYPIEMTPFIARIFGSGTMVLILSMGLFVPTLPHLFYARLHRATEAQTPWARSVFPVFLFLAICDLAWLVFLRFRSTHRKPGTYSPLVRGTVLLYSAVIVIGASQLSVRSFSRSVYPMIPFSLGGGQTRQVVFWLGTTPAPANSFLEREGTNSYSVPYELLVENENSLVVISPKDNQRAIEFDRKSVDAVIILGKRPPSAPANVQRNIPEGTAAK